MDEAVWRSSSTVTSNCPSEPYHSIHRAVYEGDLTKVRALLKEGCPLNLVDSNGSTLLHFAAQGGHVEVIRELVDRGCNLNAVDNNGCSPLHDAANNGRKEAVLELVHLGSNKLLVAGPYGSPLHQAVLNGHFETAVAMIEEGFPVDTVNSNGSTLLHCAAAGGHIEVIKLLVDNGCDVTVVDNDGGSPLHYAAGHGRKEAVLELIHLGSNMSLVAGPYGTPLHQAVLNGHLETVVAMIEEGCPLNVVNSYGSTLLHYAAQGGHVEVIRELVDRGCDVHSTKRNGYSPLHAAAGYGRKEAVLELISLGSNVSQVAGPCGTPLHQAVLFGHLETVVAMIDRGCPLDVVDSNGETLLHYAADCGYLEILRELVIKGCCVTVRHSANTTKSKDSSVHQLTPIESAISSGEGCQIGHIFNTMQLVKKRENTLLEEPDKLLQALHKEGLVDLNVLLCLAAIPGDSQFFDQFFVPSKQVIRLHHGIDIKLFKKYFARFIPKVFPIREFMPLNPLCIALFTLHFYSAGRKHFWYINEKSMNHREFIKRLISHPILKSTMNDILPNGLRPLDLARQFGLGDIVKLLEKAGGQPGLWSMPPSEIEISHSFRLSTAYDLLLPLVRSGPLGQRAVSELYKLLSRSINKTDISICKPDLADILKCVVPKIAAKYYQVGMCLGIESTTLDIVKTDHAHEGCEEICLQMFDRWLRVGPRTGDKERTWRTVLAAVKEVAGVAVCEEIEQQLHHQVGIKYTVHTWARAKCS